MNTDPQLFSKCELIQKFIDENLLSLSDEEAVDNGFNAFWEKEKEIASKKICEDESLVAERFKELVERNAKDNRSPLRDELLETLESPPGILERDNAFQRLVTSLKALLRRSIREWSKDSLTYSLSNCGNKSPTSASNAFASCIKLTAEIFLTPLSTPL